MLVMVQLGFILSRIFRIVYVRIFGWWWGAESCNYDMKLVYNA